MWCVIPAAGRGSRMGEAAGGIPKALLEVGGRPLLAWLVDALGTLVTGVCVVVDGAADAEARFREALRPFEPCRRLGLVVQAEPLGVGDAVLRAREVVQGPFVVAMGDSYYASSLAPALVDWMRSATDGGLLVERRHRAGGEPLGWVRSDGGRVQEVFKAADPGPAGLRLAGMAILPAAALLLDRPRPSPRTGEVELEQLVSELIDRDFDFRVLHYDGWRRNVNHPRDIERIRRRLQRWPDGRGRLAVRPRKSNGSVS